MKSFLLCKQLENLSRFRIRYLIRSAVIIFLTTLGLIVFSSLHQISSAVLVASQPRYKIFNAQTPSVVSCLDSHKESSTVLNGQSLSLGNEAKKCFELQGKDLYTRSRNTKDLDKALSKAQEALDKYKRISGNPKINDLIRLQASLNRLSLLVEVNEWLQSLGVQLEVEKKWIMTIQVEEQGKDSFQSKQNQWQSNLLDELRNLLLIQQDLQQLINLSPSDEAIYAQINYALNLLHLRDLELPSNVAKSSLEDVDRLLIKAIEVSRSIRSRQAEAYALNYRGQLNRIRFEKEGQVSLIGKGQNSRPEYLKLAQELTKSALRIIDSDTPLAERAKKWQWQRLAYLAESQLGRILSKGNPQGAIAVYRAAVQTLETMRKDLRSAESEVQFSFRDQVQHIYREYVSLLLQTDTQENLKTARNVIESLQLGELENFLECELSFTKSADELADEDLERVRDPKLAAAIVYPIILPDRLEIILSLPNPGASERHLVHYSPKMGEVCEKATESDNCKERIDLQLRELRYRLEQPYTSLRTQELSKKVYGWLLGEAEIRGWLQPEQTLLFIPDGALRNIPFAALYDGERYLVEKYAIAVAPRLQLLAPKSRQSKKVLIAGLTQDPDPSSFSADEPVLIKLKDSAAEIGRLQNQFQNFNINSEVLGKEKGKKFNWENLQQELKLGSYNIIHLTTHGLFGSDSDKTFIVTESGKVNLKTLENFFVNNNINPINLLVLSACETATGDDRDTLGIAGMTVRLRAQTTVASLWSINEQTSSKVMETFYQERFGDNKTKAEALRQAMIKLIRDQEVTYLPSQWAPYVLVGDWR